MTEKKTFSYLTNNLRRQADEKADKMTENPDVLSPDETRQILHELHVHQIELEIQNEELRTADGEKRWSAILGAAGSNLRAR